jgi:hypothetical protein
MDQAFKTGNLRDEELDIRDIFTEVLPSFKYGMREFDRDTLNSKAGQLKCFMPQLAALEQNHTHPTFAGPTTSFHSFSLRTCNLQSRRSDIAKTEPKFP